MQAARKSYLTRLVLKLASVVVAVAAVAVGVQAQDTSRDRMSGARHAQVEHVAAVSKAPLVVEVRSSDVWYADESSTGTRPDASH